ncbi:hypothetical protein FOA52_009052 [Chlamydomonas sp. UWO 241]|nr:hypothetical protein FOA52_009052 [Chlamydomonas sp. UWO 241]
MPGDGRSNFRHKSHVSSSVTCVRMCHSPSISPISRSPPRSSPINASLISGAWCPITSRATTRDDTSCARDPGRDAAHSFAAARTGRRADDLRATAAS